MIDVTTMHCLEVAVGSATESDVDSLYSRALHCRRAHGVGAAVLLPAHAVPGEVEKKSLAHLESL